MHHVQLCGHTQQANYFVENLHLIILLCIRPRLCKTVHKDDLGGPITRIGGTGVVGQGNTETNTPRPI